MSILRWLSKNWANTTQPTHSDLSPLVLACNRPTAIQRTITAANNLKGWSVESQESSRLHLTRRTTLMRFVDDVHVTFTDTPGGTQIDAESRSRVGQGDLGQNRRNILELWKAIRQVS